MKMLKKENRSTSIDNTKFTKQTSPYKVKQVFYDPAEQIDDSLKWISKATKGMSMSHQKSLLSLLRNDKIEKDVDKGEDIKHHHVNRKIELNDVKSNKTLNLVSTGTSIESAYSLSEPKVGFYSFCKNQPKQFAEYDNVEPPSNKIYSVLKKIGKALKEINEKIYGRENDELVGLIELRERLHSKYKIQLSSLEIELLAKKFESRFEGLVDLGLVLAAAEGIFYKEFERSKRMKTLQKKTAKTNANKLILQKSKEDLSISKVTKLVHLTMSLSRLSYRLTAPSGSTPLLILLNDCRPTFSFQEFRAFLSAVGLHCSTWEERVLCKRYFVPDTGFIDALSFKDNLIFIGKQIKSQLADISADHHHHPPHHCHLSDSDEVTSAIECLNIDFFSLPFTNTSKSLPNKNILHMQSVSIYDSHCFTEEGDDEDDEPIDCSPDVNPHMNIIHEFDEIEENNKVENTKTASEFSDSIILSCNLSDDETIPTL